MGLLFNIDKLRHKKDEDIPTLDVTVDDLNNLTEDIAEEDEPATEGAPESAPAPTPDDEAAAEPDDEGKDAEAEAAEEVPEVKKLVLRTDNLVKKYGKRTVANHVSIDVTQGEIVGLLGPNGAGKTTTFYMTVGLVQPNEGRIFLNDLDITKYPVYKRAQNGIGYLAQEPSVFRKLSVEDNIKAVLQMTGRSKEYQREKLENLIAEFRLEKVRKNLGDQLSGGERRRTEIARCLAIDPKFIMLDEPFAGVDPIAVEDIQSIVYKLKEKNIGILITDHNAPETLSITDRAYLLFEGRILFQGSSEELAENPTVREKYLGRNFIFRRKNFD
jgi:lipopolysaccharide export system ATP-binding protein